MRRMHLCSRAFQSLELGGFECRCSKRHVGPGRENHRGSIFRTEEIDVRRIPEPLPHVLTKNLVRVCSGGF